jgi:DoxX-like family
LIACRGLLLLPAAFPWEILLRVIVSAAVGRLSGFGLRTCLRGMHIAYLAVTSLAALMNGYAALMNFIGAEFVKVVADKVHVSQKWMVPFGILLAAGAVGLLLGFGLPPLGVAAAIGLIAYFICAMGAHVRVRDHNVGGAATFLFLAVATLVTDVGYRLHW